MSALAATIERALGSEDAEERRQAIAEIRGLPIEAAVPLLLRGLGDADWRVRKEATLTARTFGAAPQLLTALVTALGESDDVGLRNAAVDVLASFGSAATPALTEAARRFDADGRKLVVETLGKGRDPAAIGALAEALDDADDNVRQGAVEAIAGLGSLARERVQEILLCRLDDRDRVVRLTALEGLATLEVPIPWVRLGPLLADPTLRSAAIPAAALSDSPEAARALAALLARARGNTFEQALRALGRLADGPLDRAVAESIAAGGPDLARRLVAACEPERGGDDTIARRATAMLLGAAAGVPGIVDAAVHALDEDLLAEPARRALTTVGAPALPEIVARFADPSSSPDARAALVDVLAAILRAGTPPAAEHAALAALRRVLQDPATDRQVAVRALLPLSRSGGPEDLELAASLTLSDARPLAGAAESALATLAARFPDAARALGERLAADERALLPAVIAIGAASGTARFAESDVAFLAHAATAGDPPARRAAVHAVAEIRAAVGARFPGALEVLRVSLADEEHDVQVAAARALGRLCTARDPLPASDVLDLVDRSGPAELVAATVRALGEGLAKEQPGAPTAAADLVPALGLFARGAPSPVALAAVEALGQAQRAGGVASGPSVIAALSSALDHSDEAVVKAALLKLAAAAGASAPGAAEALARGLAHAKPAVRVLAVELLADAQPDEASRWLADRLVTEPDRRVKDAIRRALGPVQDASSITLSGSPPASGDRGEGGG